MILSRKKAKLFLEFRPGGGKKWEMKLEVWSDQLAQKKHISIMSVDSSKQGACAKGCWPKTKGSP